MRNKKQQEWRPCGWNDQSRHLNLGLDSESSSDKTAVYPWVLEWSYVISRRASKFGNTWHKWPPALISLFSSPPFSSSSSPAALAQSFCLSPAAIEFNLKYLWYLPKESLAYSKLFVIVVSHERAWSATKGTVPIGTVAPKICWLPYLLCSWQSVSLRREMPAVSESSQTLSSSLFLSFFRSLFLSSLCSLTFPHLSVLCVCLCVCAFLALVFF